MNLFRSEEHVKNWRGYEPGSDKGIMPLDDLARLFSSRFFTRRLDSDYVSQGMYLKDLLADLTELGKERPFWAPG